MSDENRKIVDAEMLNVAQNQLGLNDQDLAALMGVTDRGIRKWRKTYGYVKDQKAALLLLEWMRNPEALERAWNDIGLPEGRQVNPRGRPTKGKMG